MVAVAERLRRPDVTTHVSLFVVAVGIYMLGVALGVQWFDDGRDIQPFWVATAAIVALGLALPSRFAVTIVPGALCGELINASLVFESSATEMVGSLLANGVELVLAISLFRVVAGPDRAIVRVRQSVMWLGVATVAAASSAAFAAVFVVDPTDRLVETLRWFFGDFLGLVLVAPLGLLARQPWLVPMTRVTVFELAAHTVSLGVWSWVAFASDTSLIYVTIPELAWLAIRFGPRASFPAAAAVSMWATIRTANGFGSFANEGNGVFPVQTYNFAIGLTTLVLSALATRSHLQARVIEARLAADLDLERELGRVRRAERERIAQQLHDDPIQVLTAADLQLSAPATAESLSVIRERVRLAIDQLRETVSEIGSEEIGVDRLESGLVAVAERLSPDDRPAIRIAVEPRAALRPGDATVVYHVAREAIANAVKHAGANTIEVRVGTVEDGVAVTVTDDGCGIDAHRATHSARGHLGLRLMHERVISAGGTIQIGHGDGSGTRVRAVLPSAPDVAE